MPPWAAVYNGFLARAARSPSWPTFSRLRESGLRPAFWFSGDRSFAMRCDAIPTCKQIPEDFRGGALPKLLLDVLCSLCPKRGSREPPLIQSRIEDQKGIDELERRTVSQKSG